MLRNKSHLPLSARRDGGGVGRERGHQGLVVGPELELSRFQQRQEVLDGVVGGQGDSFQGDSFQLKNPSGRFESFSTCSRTPPM